MSGIIQPETLLGLGLGLPDPNLLGSQQPEIIEEDIHELVDYTSPPEQQSDQDGTKHAIAAIKDPHVAVPLTTTKWKRPAPSTVTDLGNRLYAQRRDKRTQAYDKSPGPLSEKLNRAMRADPGLSGSFCPNGALLRLINEDSVVDELERHEEALLAKKKSAEKAKKIQEKGVRGLQTQAKKVGKTLGAGIRNRIPSFDNRSTKSRCLARQICGTLMSAGGKSPAYRKIFAILVMIEMSHKIKRFIKEGICDDDLPLTKRVVSGQTKLFRRMPSNMYRLEKKGFFGGQKGEGGLLARLLDRGVDKPLKCFRGWDINKRNRFEEAQWTMLAPFFARDDSSDSRPIRHYRLQPKVVMPFTLWQEVSHNGASGQIYKAQIHEDHHGFDPPQSKFAIKRLHTENIDDFKKEIAMLKLLSGIKHPHLISLLTTYEQHNQYHLVFHWAESDLLTYWRDANPKPTVNYQNTRWILVQCAGIAGGLVYVHKPHETAMNTKSPLCHLDSLPALMPGRRASHGTQSQLLQQADVVGHHGDIKSQNILLFTTPSGGTDECNWSLKISDFGLAGFRSSRNTSLGNTPAYAAPECAIPGGPLTSSACDIWALGCLYLEFVAWFLGGWDLLKEFESRRILEDDRPTFYVTKHDGERGLERFEIKLSVVTLIEQLCRDHKCSDHIRELLGVIRNHILIVETNRNAPSKIYRYDCKQVEQRLRAIAEAQDSRDTGS